MLHSPLPCLQPHPSGSVRVSDSNSVPQGIGQHLPLLPAKALTRLGPLAYLPEARCPVTDTSAVTTTIFNYLALASACPQLHAALAMLCIEKTLAACSLSPVQAQARCPQPQ